MGDVGGDAPRPEFSRQLLRLYPAVTEHQPSLAAVEHGDDLGGVLQGADPVEGNLGVGA